MRRKFRSNTDVVFVVGFAVFVVLVFLSGVFDDTLAQAFVGGPLLAVIPGYVLLAALLPRSGPSRRQTKQRDPSESTKPYSYRGISGVEWWVTSIGLSIVVVAALSYGLLVSPFAFNTVTLHALLTTVIAVFAFLAVSRRSRLSEEERYEPNLKSWFAGIQGLFSTDSNYDLVLSIVLGASILLLVGSVAFAAGGSQQAPTYSEFYILTENESGELVTANYPTTINTNESADMVVGISNHEDEKTDYTLVVELQRVDGTSENATVVEETELRRKEVTVEANGWWRLYHSVEPALGPGENIRVSYYLYRGDAPSDPSRQSAYRYLEHWMTVTSDS